MTLQFKSVRVLANSATSQIHSSRLHRCFEPCTQSDSKRSSAAKLLTFKLFKVIVSRRAQTFSVCKDESNRLDATSQCNSTIRRPASRLSDRLCCVRSSTANWASVHG